MAIVRIQANSSTTSNGAATTAASFLAGTAAHSLIVLGISGTGISVTGVADDKGNSYTQVPSARGVIHGTPDRASDLWYLPNCTAGTETITVTYSSTIDVGTEMYLIEYSGVALAGPVETAGNVSNLNTDYLSPVGPVLTTARTGSVLVSLATIEDYAVDRKSTV